MDSFEKILASSGNEATEVEKILLGSAGIYLTFLSKPDTAYGLDPEGELIAIPYTETT